MIARALPPVPRTPYHPVDMPSTVVFFRSLDLELGLRRSVAEPKTGSLTERGSRARHGKD